MKENETLGRRIRRKREENGLTQEELAKLMGYKDKSTIAKIENGTNDITQSKIAKFAEILGTTPSCLMGWNDGDAQPRRGVKIPVVAYVAAGLPIEAIENVIDWEEITEEMARRGTFFGLKIKGNSMEPFINDGDVVIVRKQPDADEGDIVVALVNGNEGVCKKLAKYPGGIVLESINTTYSPMSFTDQQIGDYPVTIAGKVVEIRRKL